MAVHGSRRRYGRYDYGFRDRPVPRSQNPPTIVIPGYWLTSEAPDVVSVTALYLPAITGVLATTEAPDTVAMAGQVVTGIAAVLAATEAPDVVSFTARAPVVASLATTEAPDVVAFTASLSGVVTGVLAATEAPDIVVIAATAPNAVATLATTEAPDTVSATATVAQQVTASLATTEAPDSVSIAARTLHTAALATTEAPDTVAVNARTLHTATLAATEAPDTVAMSASVVAVYGMLATTEAPDTVSMAATVAAGANEDTDAANYLNAQTTAPSSTERSLVDALVKGLKSDGDWASFDWIVLLASETAQAARLNLKNPAKSLSAVNLPTFTANRGYAGDESSSYLNFNELPTVSGNKYVLNSATFGIWCNQESVGFSNIHIGTNNASTVYLYAPKTNQAQGQISVNDSNGGEDAGPATGSRTGHRTGVRVSSGTKRAYLNGNLGTEHASASSTVPASPLTIGKLGTTYGADRFALAYYGAALTTAAVGRIHSRFQTYLNAKGAA